MVDDAEPEDEVVVTQDEDVADGHPRVVDDVGVVLVPRAEDVAVEVAQGVGRAGEAAPEGPVR